MLLQPTADRAGSGNSATDMKLDHPPAGDRNDTVVQVNDLLKRFGDFVAVDHVSFEVRRGEIFGLLGPNGAGKTTTFRMLCGLLNATSGDLKIAGADLRRSPVSVRQKIGYVAQKFSLYAQLSVAENLDFFASAYGLHGLRRRQRIDWAMARFDSAPSPVSSAGCFRAATSSVWRRPPPCSTSRTSYSWMKRPAGQILWRDASFGGGSPLWRNRA